ncbi:MAG: ABC transporter permease [Gemmatimonadota bacterium]
MRAPAWRQTWKLTLRRRRLFAWNVAIPVLLLVPVVTSGAAASHRAIVLAVFVAFFGAYGSCIPLIRDGMSGWVEKVLLTGYEGRRWLAERTAACAAIDLLQLLPATVLLLWLVDASARTALLVLVATALALAFANLLGVLVAAVVRALGEAALGCAVFSLFALHAAGVFRTPAPGSAWDVAERWSPFRPVHEVWLSALRRGGADPGARAVPWARWWDAFGLPALSLLGFAILVYVVGSWSARRIARSRSD